MSEAIIKGFTDAYGKAPVAVAKAPGRLEILGNHTDYNDGIVLSAAVGQTTEFAIAPVEGTKCCMRDFRDGSYIEFDLNDIDEPKPKDWTNYVKGVIVELRKRDIEIGAFEGAILSTVPLSAGMSSSAALEVSAGLAFSVAFDIDLPKEEWAKIGQGVENNYMGLQSGLLDQFSSLFGQEDALIYCDFRTVEVLRTVDLPHGYVLVVVNSMIKHDLVDSDYNQRREACEQVVAKLQAKYPEVKALRDVTPEMLDDSKDLVDHIDYLRAKHVVGEIDRVIKGVEALDNKDIDTFGKLLIESHESSKVNFENSCPELDYLVELSESIPGCIGSRLSGGGFGGISVHLVKEEDAENYCDRMRTAFKQQTGVDPQTIICTVGAGASVVKL
jgi:galactokinase